MTLARLLGHASHSGGLGHTVFLSVFGFHSFGSSSFLPNFKNEPSFSGAKLFRVWLPRTENFLHHILKRSQYIYYLQEIWMFIDCQNISKVQTAWMFPQQRKLPNYINSLVWWLSSHLQAAERRVAAVKTFPNICMLWGFYQHFWELGFSHQDSPKHLGQFGLKHWPSRRKSLVLNVKPWWRLLKQSGFQCSCPTKHLHSDWTSNYYLLNYWGMGMGKHYRRNQFSFRTRTN